MVPIWFVGCDAMDEIIWEPEKVLIVIFLSWVHDCKFAGSISLGPAYRSGIGLGTMVGVILMLSWAPVGVSLQLLKA